MTALAHQLQPRGLAPRLVLLPPYRAPERLAASVFWKRRLAAVVLLITLVVGAWSLAGIGIGFISSAPKVDTSIASKGLVGASPVAQPQTWIVRPGDTLWSIARTIKPSGDIRPVLNPLIKQYSSQPLQVGQAISVPDYEH